MLFALCENNNEIFSDNGLPPPHGLDFAGCLIYLTRKKVTYKLLSYEYNF